MSILSNPRKDMGYPTTYPTPTSTLPFYGTAKSGSDTISFNRCGTHIKVGYPKRWYIHGINPWGGMSVEYRILGVTALVQTNN